MGNMLEHPAHADSNKRGVFKGLIGGESGVGKTGMLASLVDAGYKLRVLDFDAGLDPLAGYVKDKSKLANVEYETLRDEFKIVGTHVAVKKAPAFQRAMALLNDWPGLGPVQSWDPDDILVLDTLGKAAKSAFYMILQANGVVVPSGQRGGPEQSHYGAAMDNISRMLSWLTNPNVVPCHVIVNAHWMFDEGSSKSYPETIGSKLSPTVLRDFNNAFSVSITAGQRTIKVKKDGLIACKSSKPLDKETYPIETGMADIFKQLVGPPPKS